MKTKTAPTQYKLTYLSLTLNGLLLIGFAVLMIRLNATGKDVELNRMKENVTSSAYANLRQCYIKGDTSCPENKYIDSSSDRAALRDFLAK